MSKRIVFEYFYILRRGVGKIIRGVKRGLNIRFLNFSYLLFFRFYNGKKYFLKGCEEVFKESSSVGFIFFVLGGEGNFFFYFILVKSRGLKSISFRIWEIG